MPARTLSVGALLLASLAASALAQNVLFSESFTNGIPAGWTHRALGTLIDPWSPGISPVTSSPDVFHEYFCAHGFFFRDNALVSPRIDLSGFLRAGFSCVQHQTYPLQRYSNRVEISTNGGQTFALLYAETGTWSGPGAINVNLDAWAGLPDVRIAFHYQGTIANEWRIDDVRITTPQPVLAINGVVAGAPTTFAWNGGTPGAFVVMAISFHGSGPLPTPFGLIHLSQPILSLPFQIADAAGNAASTHTFPAWATGIQIHSHAGELLANGSVNLSNWRMVTLQ